ENAIRFYHFRDRDKAEVDIVMQQGRCLAGVEIKASATLSTKDFHGLKKMQNAAGKQFAAGALFYDGDSILPFGDRLYAVPLSLLV
ncbi:MAG: AAA family ATPase, partial [Gammaproteobacteria bacterium]